jgi:lipoprotein-anchoring transpeptidase ErfK/SrfK
MFTSFVQPPQMQISPPAGSPASLQLESAPDEESESVQLSARLQRQIVRFPSHEAPDTILIDTPNTFLYYILGNGKAIRYGIGVGREGFTWSGVKSVTRKAEWPDWYPPAQMIVRQPYLPAWSQAAPAIHSARMPYIGGTEFRIHGTNDPTLASRCRVAASA